MSLKVKQTTSGQETINAILKLHEVMHLVAAIGTTCLVIQLWWRCVSAVITVLLSMTVFQLIVMEKVPESSHAVPLIGTSHGAITFTARSQIRREPQTWKTRDKAK